MTLRIKVVTRLKARAGRGIQKVKSEKERDKYIDRQIDKARETFLALQFQGALALVLHIFILLLSFTCNSGRVFVCILCLFVMRRCVCASFIFIGGQMLGGP